MAACKRINFLKVPVDIVTEDNFEDVIRDLVTKGGKHQIVLLSFRKLMKARRNNEYRELVKSASLVIPTSKSILFGTRFLHLLEPVRWMPFEFIIRILGVLETGRRSVYFLGGKPAAINTAASNLRASFPGLNIVGRHSGYFKKDVEENLLLAIRKAGPSLLLTGSGIRGKDKWLHQHMREFADGLFLWDSDCFEIFAGKKKRIPKETWNRGTEGVHKVLTRPWKMFRLFQYAYFGLILLVYKIRR